MANLLKIKLTDGTSASVRMEDLRTDRGLFAVMGADFIWQLTETSAIVHGCERDWHCGLVTLGGTIENGPVTVDYSNAIDVYEDRREEQERERRYRANYESMRGFNNRHED